MHNHDTSNAGSETDAQHGQTRLEQFDHPGGLLPNPYWVGQPGAPSLLALFCSLQRLASTAYPPLMPLSLAQGRTSL